MKKRILSIALALAMCLSLLPAMALAAEGDASISLTTGADQAGDGWSWNAASMTLTLENCNLTFTSDGFYLPSGATVLVKGNNTIIAGSAHQSGTAIWVNPSDAPAGSDALTIQSEDGNRGSLTVACDTVSGTPSRNGTIAVRGGNGNLVFRNVDIHVAGENNCLRGPNVIVDNSAITAKASEHGTPDNYVLYGDYDVIIQNDSVITAETKNATWGICANDNDLTITDSSVSLTETFDEASTSKTMSLSCYGLQGTKNVSITNSDIDIQMTMTEAVTSSYYKKDANICGIVTGYQNISIANSQVAITNTNNSQDANAYNYGIVSYGGDISVTDNSQLAVNAANSSEPVGIVAIGSMTVDTSTVKSTATNSLQDGYALEMLSCGGFTLTNVDIIQGKKYTRGTVGADDYEEDITACSTFNPEDNNSYPTGGTSIIGASASGVTLEPETLQLSVGDSAVLTATVSPASTYDKSLLWTTSNDKVVTVDESGNVTAIAPGTATITATTVDGGKTATCEVTVSKTAQAALTISGVPETVYPGDSFTLTAEGGSGTGNITWSVSGPAEIDQNGTVKVTGIGKIEVKVVKEGDTDYAQTECSVSFTAVSKPSVTPSCDGGKDCPSHHLTDVNTHEWYHESVDYAVTHGLMQGTSATTFEPLTTTSRAMLVTILYRLDGSPAVGTPTFADVAANQWYSKAVVWAADKGIAVGYGNGKFGPNDTVTREQTATILYRYAQYKGFDMSKLDNLSAYSDAGSIASFAKTPVQWCVANKIISGKPGNLLDPAGNASRAEVAAVLMRFCENIAK